MPESNNPPKISEDQMWHEIKHNYYSVLEVTTEIMPWDIHVRIHIPSPGEKSDSSELQEGESRKRMGPNTRYTIDLGSFFARYPELNFTNVAFLQPTGRTEANERIILKDLLAVFGEDMFKTRMEIPRHKKTNAVQISKSRIHAIQLFYIFKKPQPEKVGEIKELFIKLTPILDGSDRKSKKAWRMTLFSKTEVTTDKKIKPPKVVAKKAARKGAK